jgi:hypothetical protein
MTKQLASSPPVIFLILPALIINLSTRGQTHRRNDSYKDTSACQMLIGDSDHIFNKMDCLADFSENGYTGWLKFVQGNFDFNYITARLPDTIKVFNDSIRVKFTVNRDGAFCALHMIGGNTLLWSPTIRLFEHTKWLPGSMEGRQINSYRSLQITVQMDRIHKVYFIKRSLDDYFLRNQ